MVYFIHPHGTHCNESVVIQTAAIIKNTFNIILKIIYFIVSSLLYFRQ